MDVNIPGRVNNNPCRDNKKSSGQTESVGVSCGLFNRAPSAYTGLTMFPYENSFHPSSSGFRAETPPLVRGRWRSSFFFVSPPLASPPVFVDASFSETV